MSLLKYVFRATKGASSALAIAFLAMSSADAQTTTTVIDDSFADGINDSGALTAAGTPQLGFNVTSSNAALDVAQAPGPVDFASGDSSRTIHTLFPAQTLTVLGDVLTVTFDFTTPDSIRYDNFVQSTNEDFKFGIFDTSGTAGLIDSVTLDPVTMMPLNTPIDFAGPVNTTSGTPNTALNALAGIQAEIDNINTPGSDLGIRTFNVGNDAGFGASAPIGQFLNSNTGFDFIAGGDDGLITLAPNTNYTGTISVAFTDAALDAIDVTVAMADGSGVTIDMFTRSVSIANIAPDAAAVPPITGNIGVQTTTFDLLAFHATSGAFGGTNGPVAGSSAVGEANNGIDISNVTVVFTDASMMNPVLKGDVDQGGMVTFLDINPFIVLLAANGFQLEADCDCDGDLDFLDIQPFIDILAGN